jgi:asparagine synthase (glutamine-hydrolysing)
MCGIWSLIDLLEKYNNNKELYENFMELKNRGPDITILHNIKNVYIGFHRLAIMDVSFHANQPYIIEDNERTIVFICNGEIYNFKELINEEKLNITNNSDCLTIPLLYIKYTKYESCGFTNIDNFYKLFLNKIKGEFAFILYEFDQLHNIKQIICGRDQVGIRPLYYNKPNTDSDTIVFSSEIKGLKYFKNNIYEFPPGQICQINIDSLKYIISTDYYSFKTIYNHNNIFNDKQLLVNIRESVINSVKRRLISDKPIAFLLSGGVDSSLVASIASKLLNEPINTFCCGMEGGTDLLYAKKVAEHINSNHKEIIITPEEGLQAIKDVIYTIESWDVTTIRASVGQYMVCSYIGTKTDFRVVMVGEGPDEVCSSYLFNYYAPSDIELDKCAKEFVENIHLYDVKRADRCISRWGLEGRVALLDPEFISTYWEIPANKRMPTYKNIEKWWLREAFNDSHNLLPDDILWRKKEAFSDGISQKNKSWFEIINDYIDTLISNDEYLFCNKWNCPSKEAYYYKKIFVEFFGEDKLNIIPNYWQPKFLSDGTINDTYIDPSARILSIY